MEDTSTGANAPATSTNGSGHVAGLQKTFKDKATLKAEAKAAASAADRHFAKILDRDLAEITAIRKQFKGHVPSEEADKRLEQIEEYEHCTTAAIHALQAIARSGLDMSSDDRHVHMSALLGYKNICAALGENIFVEELSQPILDFVTANKSQLLQAGVRHGPAINGNGHGNGKTGRGK